MDVSAQGEGLVLAQCVHELWFLTVKLEPSGFGDLVWKGTCIFHEDISAWNVHYGIKKVAVFRVMFLSLKEKPKSRESAQNGFVVIVPDMVA